MLLCSHKDKERIYCHVKNKQKSINTLSEIFCILIFVLLTVSVFALPSLMRFFIDIFEKPIEYFLPTVIILYFVLIPAFVAVISLFLLLRNIKNEKIFTRESVAFLRTISWCCMGAGAMFFVLGFYYYMVFLISFAAFFMGAILRVVKNVIEEATEIKSENDFTI